MQRRVRFGTGRPDLDGLRLSLAEGRVMLARGRTTLARVQHILTEIEVSSAASVPQVAESGRSGGPRQAQHTWQGKAERGGQ